MGGTALGVQADRMDKYIYNELEADVLTLQAKHGYMRTIPTFRNKRSFGDMDIVYRNDLYTVEDIIENFKYINGKYLKLLKSKKNGNVLSVLVNYDPDNQQSKNKYQIDFIGYSEDIYDFAYHYHSYGDRGNLIGRIARQFDLKFGHNGLFYIQRDKEDWNVKLYDHLITDDFREALFILGFGINPKLEFNDVEEMYEWICSSKLFNKEAFQFQNRPNKDVSRDKKREMYLGFLDYLEQTPIMSMNIDKTTFLNCVFNTYNMNDEIESVYKKQEINKEYKKVFNGKIVSDLTGLSGEELGKFMTYFFKWSAYSKEKIIQWSASDQLRKHILEVAKWYIS